MNEKIVSTADNYFEEIDMPQQYIARAFEILKFYRKYCPEEIAGVFVTDYVKEEGIHEYENLWLFSETYCMEAKSFLRQDNFDMDVFGKKIISWEISKKNYNLKKATKESRLFLNFELAPLARLSVLKASGNNCDFLIQIFEKYVLPNMNK